jgi:hypothetical protein
VVCAPKTNNVKYLAAGSRPDLHALLHLNRARVAVGTAYANQGPPWPISNVANSDSSYQSYCSQSGVRIPPMQRFIRQTRCSCQGDGGAAASAASFAASDPANRDRYPYSTHGGRGAQDVRTLQRDVSTTDTRRCFWLIFFVELAPSRALREVLRGSVNAGSYTCRNRCRCDILRGRTHRADGVEKRFERFEPTVKGRGILFSSPHSRRHAGATGG